MVGEESRKGQKHLGRKTNMNKEKQKWNTVFFFSMDE